MIIYEFSTWFAKGNDLFVVTEIEVEEKPKSYTGKGTRILKDDLNKLLSGYGSRMYCLSNDPKPYIEAMIQKKTNSVERLESDLIKEKALLSRWKALKESEED